MVFLNQDWMSMVVQLAQRIGCDGGLVKRFRRYTTQRTEPVKSWSRTNKPFGHYCPYPSPRKWTTWPRWCTHQIFHLPLQTLMIQSGHTSSRPLDSTYLKPMKGQDMNALLLHQSSPFMQNRSKTFYLRSPSRKGAQGSGSYHLCQDQHLLEEQK